MKITNTTKIELEQDELGAITFHYFHDCDDAPEFEETVEINPYFYADAGIPVCSECGDDMGLVSATIETETA